MPSPFNENNQKGFNQKPKNKKLNRTAILTIVTLAIAIIVVATAAILANRTNKPIEPPQDTSSTLPPETQAPTTDAPQSTDAPKATEKSTGSTNVGSKVPSFILPVSGVLSNSHNPDLQVYSPTMNDYRVHLGIDLVTKENAPVYASADGKVEKIWVDPMMGYCMAIAHSGSCVTIYKNLAEELPRGIAEGVSVRSGQLIANVGESAMVEVGEEPHLHFEMTVSDLAVDPLKYFDETSLESIKNDTTHE